MRRHELVLGGLRFVIGPDEGLRLVERDPLYRPFRRGAAADREIEVRVTLDPAPDLDGLPVLFDTEETWVAYAAGDDVVLRLRSAAGPEQPLWVARLTGEPLARVTVHCGPGLVESRGEEVVLHSPLHYPLDQLLIMFALPFADGVLVHAAGFSRGGRGVFCAGVSGAGKTTLTRCLDPAGGLEALSDDRVIARWISGEARLFGTPWAGEGRVAESRDVELAAVIFLHQSRRNELRPIGGAQAMEQLLATVSILWFDRVRLEWAMTCCQRLVETFPCYELHFRPEPEALRLLDAIL